MFGSYKKWLIKKYGINSNGSRTSTDFSMAVSWRAWERITEIKTIKILSIDRGSLAGQTYKHRLLLKAYLIRLVFSNKNILLLSHGHILIQKAQSTAWTSLEELDNLVKRKVLSRSIRGHSAEKLSDEGYSATRESASRKYTWSILDSSESFINSGFTGDAYSHMKKVVLRKGASLTTRKVDIVIRKSKLWFNLQYNHWNYVLKSMTA